MNKIIITSLVASIVLSSSYAADIVLVEEKKDREISIRKTVDTFGRIEQKDISTVEKFKQMFIQGKVTGQVRSMYAGYNQKAVGEVDTYATAIGGMLKYELASLNGFNAGVALTTSHDISGATGSLNKQNDELSSANGSYNVLSEAYINYKNGGFNFRAGRQMMDTPLADSDDIRMIPNTFEAYIASYEMNDFTFTAGNVRRWQGADAGLGYDGNGVRLDSEWVDVGSDGTLFAGVTYESDLRINAWYYDIPKQTNATKATYIDIGRHQGDDELSIHAALQYLHETEAQNSGVKADIYGALVEVMAYGVGLNIAYNKSTKHMGKRSFSGIGGGSMYTSMDTMIIDEIAQDRDAEAIVVGLGYSINNWEFLYAYGDFKGEEDSSLQKVKAHIVEQNMGFQYTVNDEFVVAGIYVKEEDKENTIATANDWDRMQFMVKYDF